MLILTRKPAERLLIGDAIVIEIREVRGNQVSIGIQAPPEVKVLREELRDRDQPPDAVGLARPPEPGEVPASTCP